MVSLLTVSKAQNKLSEYLRSRRLKQGLTQEGLANRSGVSLGTLRKFEQKGVISLESFLKLAMVLGCLEEVVNGAKPVPNDFSSIDDVLKKKDTITSRKGWRK